MATQIAPLTDAAYTLEQAVLTDTIANEVYAAHYNERRTSRIVIGGLSVLLLGAFASIVVVGTQARHQSLHPHRRDGQGPGHPVQRFELLPA